MHHNQQQRTIVARATPCGRSALAMIRISGPQSIAITARLIRNGTRLVDAESHTVHYTTITDTEQGNPIDNVVVLLYRAPNSYTGEDVVEICCHGNPNIVEEIITLYQQCGAAPAEAGEFTLQALANGRLDLTQAEAVGDIIAAEGKQAREIALSHLHGDLRAEIETIKQALVHVAAGINIQLDYPIEESGDITVDSTQIAKSRAALQRLLATYRVGRLSYDGVVAVLIGKVNSGKSSLFNRLLREERAIVSEHAGTTRDYIEGRIAVNGLPIRLFDTAGIRHTTHEVEQIGIERTQKIIAGAEIILYVADSSVLLSNDEKQEINYLLRAQQEKNNIAQIIIVRSKSDLISAQTTTLPLLDLPIRQRAEGNTPIPAISVSAKTGAGVPQLIDALKRAMSAYQRDVAPSEGGVIVSSERQMLLLKRAEHALKQAEQQQEARMPLDMQILDIEDAIAALGQITGEVTTADMLREMFSNFCVGK